MEKEFKKLIKEALREVLQENRINQQDIIMTVKQLTEYTGISGSWIYAHQNEIPHIKIKKNIRFRKSEIDEWISEKRVEEVQQTKINVRNKTCSLKIVD